MLEETKEDERVPVLEGTEEERGRWFGDAGPESMGGEDIAIASKRRFCDCCFEVMQCACFS